MCSNSQCGRYKLHLQTGSITLNTQQRHCLLHPMHFNCQTIYSWMKFIVFKNALMQRGLKHNYSYSFSSHLLRWLLKQNKHRNQFDFKGCSCVCVMGRQGKNKKRKKKLFKSWSQLISITSCVSYRVSGPPPWESVKERKWEKWEKEEEEVWRRVLGQKAEGDYSSFSHV